VKLTIFKSAFVLFAIGLILLELGARLAPNAPERLSDHQYRNSTPLRGWPEYTSRMPSDGGVILIGNSQSLGQEFSDVSKIYPYQLSQELAKQDISFQNWSISGARVDQLEWFAMQAAKLKPKLLVFSVSASTINAIKSYRFTTDATDLNLSIGEVSNLSKLSGNFFTRDFEVKDWLIRFLKRHSYFLRSRTEWFDYLASNAKEKHHKALFGHRRIHVARENLDLADIEEPQAGEARFMQNRYSADRWARQFRHQNLPTFKIYFENLSKLAEKQDFKILWVWMPFAQSDSTQALGEGMGLYFKDACDIVHANNHVCIDLRNSIGPSNFVSHDISSHLSAQGHSEYAKLLLPIIKDAVH
jgi:hypothetical protein